MPRLLVAVLLSVLALPLFAAPASHADLGLELEVVERVSAGESVYAFGYVRNYGPDAAENVVITASEGRFRDGTGCLADDESRCTMKVFPPGQYIALTLILPPQNDLRDIHLRLDVTSTTPDPNQANNHGSRNVAITLATAMRFHLNTPIADPGQTIEVESMIINDSYIPARDVSFVLPLPEGWSFERSLSEELKCAVEGRSVRCTIAEVAPRSQLRSRFLMRAPNTTSGQRYTSAQVRLTAANGLINADNYALAYFVTTIYRHIQVTSAGDDGEGSLRNAIGLANERCTPISNDAPCKIVFDIAGGGSHHTIQLRTPLPSIKSYVQIEGGTQTARHGNTNPAGPEIEINGSLLASGDGFDLDFEGGGLQLRDLAINGFPGNGVVIRATGWGRVIERCYIGTDVTGQHAVPNGGRGVVIDIPGQYTGANVIIRDSIISGNRRSGVFVASGYGVTLTGNGIGASAGERPLPLGNGASGIYFGPGASALLVQKNIIAFNAESGIATAKTTGFLAIRANSIFGNGLLGIDYGLDLVTPNPAPDAYSDVPPFPVLTAARFDPATNITRIEGRVPVRWLPNIADVELFANTAPGNQGELFLGRISLRPDLTFSFDYVGDLRGRVITATFTMPNNYYPEVRDMRTSELSEGMLVEGAATAPIDPALVVPAGADLRLRSFSPYGVHAGMTTRMVVALENLGPETASNIVIDVTSDRGRLIPANSMCTAVGDGLRCNVPEGVGYVDFDVAVPIDATTLTIDARVTSDTPDPDPSSNSTTLQVMVTTEPLLDLRVEWPGAVDPGAIAHYTAYVRHHTATPARDVVVHIGIQGGWSLQSGPANGWHCEMAGNELVCRTPLIEGQTTSSFSYTLRAPNDEQGGTRSSEYAYVTSTPKPLHLFSTYVGYEVFRIIRVSTTADDGPGSLRGAITQANEECDPYRYNCKIVFSIEAAQAANGVFSIRPTWPLPRIEADGVIVDARTQTDHTGDTNPLGPEVELNGSLVGQGNGLEITSLGTTGVRGFAINGFPDNGVMVHMSTGYTPYNQGRTVAGNYIGTDPTGQIPVPNGGRGVTVVADADQWTSLAISGNVISGNARAGVFVASGRAIRIVGNRIGLTAGDHPSPLSNGASGVYLGVVEGVTVEGNSIAHNAHAGIGLDSRAIWHSIRGNAIFDNGGLGVDHGLDLVTFNNDSKRPQDLPRFPEITSAVWDESARVTRISGRVEALASSRGLIVELFASPTPDETGYGEAARFLGEVRLPRSENEETFTYEIAEDLRGQFVTSTLSAMGFDNIRQAWTSEISQAVPVQ